LSLSLSFCVSFCVGQSMPLILAHGPCSQEYSSSSGNSHVAQGQLLFDLTHHMGRSLTVFSFLINLWLMGCAKVAELAFEILLKLIHFSQSVFFSCCFALPPCLHGRPPPLLAFPADNKARGKSRVYFSFGVEGVEWEQQSEKQRNDEQRTSAGAGLACRMGINSKVQQ